MLKSKMVVISVLIILVSILALQLFATSVLAAPSKRIQSSLPLVDQSFDSLKFEAGLSVIDAENRKVQVIAPNVRPLTKEENIFQQIVSYKEKIDAYAMQPGWTLVKYDQYDILPTTGPKPLPTKHQRETWSHFDKTKQVFEEVEYVIAPELGRVLLGYFAHGEVVSLWNDTRYQQQPYAPSYDLYLVSSVRDALNSNVNIELNSLISALGNTETTIVELKNQFSDEDKKWLPISFEQAVWRTLERFYFDSNTGMLLRYEHNYLLTDMTLVPAAITDNFQITPNLQPPADVVKRVSGE